MKLFMFVVAFTLLPSHSVCQSWIAALNASQRYYTRDAKLLVIGDSIAKGVGCSTDQRTDLCSWVYQFKQKMRSRGFNVAGSFDTGIAPGVTDARWTSITGFHQQFTGFGGKTGWQSMSGSTTLQLTASGGYTTTINTAGSSETVAKVTVAAATYWNNDNKLDIRCGSSTLTYDPGSTERFDRFDVYFLQDQGFGTCFVTAVEPWSSLSTNVRIANAGVPGATSADWTLPWSIASIRSYQPDLTIISLGPNDAAVGLSPDQYRSNVEQLIQVGRESGDVILMSFLPSWTGQIPDETPYYDELASVAADEGIILIDIWKEFDRTFQRFLMFDGVHATSEGYAVIATLTDGEFFNDQLYSF